MAEFNQEDLVLALFQPYSFSRGQKPVSTDPFGSHGLFLDAVPNSYPSLFLSNSCLSWFHSLHRPFVGSTTHRQMTVWIIRPEGWPRVAVWRGVDRVWKCGLDCLHIRSASCSAGQRWGGEWVMKAVGQTGSPELWGFQLGVPKCPT